MTHFYSTENPYIAPVIIKGVAFDNDNTLYIEPENSKEIHKLAAFRAIKHYIPNLKKANFIQMIAESSKKYGGSLEIFTKEYDIDQNELRNRHYKNLIDLAQKTDFFASASVPYCELNKLRKCNIPMVIATHGNMEWSLFANKKNRLSDYFNEQSIVTKDHAGINKAKGTRMYEIALNKLGAPTTEQIKKRGIGYAMIENTAKNLRYAKELGMTTILIMPKNMKKADIPSYVDVVVPDNRTSIECLQISNAIRYDKINNNLDDTKLLDSAEITI